MIGFDRPVRKYRGRDGDLQDFWRLRLRAPNPAEMWLRLRLDLDKIRPKAFSRDNKNTIF